MSTPRIAPLLRLRHRFRRLVVLLAALLITGFPARAQLSPGPLFKGHENLEGVENCTKCHEIGRQLSSARCLACHGALAARISAGRGLHASTTHAVCENCHVEHQGRDTPLAWWGEKGVRAFDHRETGWKLEGKHATLECRSCHASQRIRDGESLQSGAANPERTYLGLRTDCQSCHQDPHAGQLGADCGTCHNSSRWDLESAFDHSRARFVLAGRHKEVPCAKCHPPVREDSDSAETTEGAVPRQWRGVRFADCADCHADPHSGRLGATCGGCHSSEGWKDVATARFDHDRTRYPLRGQHAPVKCNGCHRPGSPIRGLSFAACSDCHDEQHGKQFEASPDGSDCGRCHTVEGYARSTYTVAQHTKTRYALTGAHLAVPCIACHARPTAAAPVSAIPFRFESTRCVDCHRDPHRGEVDEWFQKGGCEGCHRVESWAAISFDHSRAKFPLEGKHTSASCSDCHSVTDSGSSPRQTRLRGIATDCAACHDDPHSGQFADASLGTTRCDRCHDTTGWKANRFDHNRDAAFRLDGAHLKADCARCHPRTGPAGAQWTLYRPIDTKCVACHPWKEPRDGNPSTPEGTEGSR